MPACECSFRRANYARTSEPRSLFSQARFWPTKDVGSSVAISAFIATNPEALLPHSIALTPPLGANLLTPNSLRRGAGLGGPELESLDCEHVFDRLLPTVERNIKEATVRLAGRRAIIIRWWIEDRDSWNQRPCSKSRLAVPPAGGICTPVTMT